MADITLPTPGVTPGPIYAQQINNAISSVNNELTGLPERFSAIPSGPPTATALPTSLYNPIEANAVAFGRSNLVQRNGFQYCVWWNAGRRPVIGKRSLGSSTWTTFELGRISGNPLNSPLPNDGHNNLVVALDSEGYLHVSGNMHGVPDRDEPLRYIRSAQPEDITSWVSGIMVGSDENKITYPQFVKAPNGDLLFIYRNGTSISGDTYLNRYNVASKTWSRVTKLLEGSSFNPAENGYLDQAMVSDDGRIGLFMVWRAGSNFLSTHDISYIQSRDNGGTWESITGEALQLPILPPRTTGGVGSRSPVAFPVPQNAGWGLINQCGAVFDAAGNPHTARWLYDLPDKSVYRLHHFSWNGSAWVDEVVETLNGMPVSSVGTIAIARPALVRNKRGKVAVLWRNNIQDPSSLWVSDVSPNGPRFSRFEMVTVDLGGYEPNLDYDSMLEDKFSALVTPAYRDPNQLTGTSDWFAQWGVILEFDLNRLEEMAQSPLNLIRSLNSTNAGNTSELPLLSKKLELTSSVSDITAASSKVTVFQSRPEQPLSRIPLTSTSATGPRVSETSKVPTRPDIDDYSAGLIVTAVTEPAGRTNTVESFNLGVGSSSVVYTGRSGATLDSLGRLAAYWRFSNLGLADGASINQVNDVSGNNRPLSPYDGPRTPTYSASGLNGFGAARFASGQALRSSAFAIGNTFSLVTVARADQVSTAAQQIVSAWDSGLATPPLLQFRYVNSNVSSVSRTQLGGNNELLAATAPTQVHVLGVRRMWSNYRFDYEIWIDGVLAAAFTPAPSGSSAGATGSAPWYVGARLSGGTPVDYLAGYVGDTAIFSEWLNDVEWTAAQLRVARPYNLLTA
jgi:putative BNR repeat neuraminidase